MNIRNNLRLMEPMHFLTKIVFLLGCIKRVRYNNESMIYEWRLYNPFTHIIVTLAIIYQIIAYGLVSLYALYKQFYNTEIVVNYRSGKNGLYNKTQTDLNRQIEERPRYEENINNR